MGVKEGGGGGRKRKGRKKGKKTPGVFVNSEEDAVLAEGRHFRAK
jgi:hypothetical protein